MTLPIIINGRMDRPGDWDVFEVEGKAGETIVAEVSARRLGSPLDSFLKVTGADGKIIALERRSFRRGIGVEHRPRRFLPHGEAARRRKILRSPRRHAAARQERSMPTGSGSASRSPISRCV